MNHSFPFDPTYGYDLAALQQVAAPAEPEGFSSFWRSRYQQVRGIDPQMKRHEIAVETGRRTFEIEFSSFDGFRVGGWVTLPQEGSPVRAMVVSHGYGGRDAPDTGPLYHQTAAIFPCARGFNRSARPDLPAESAAHVLWGIESKETYLVGLCAADLWMAVSALLSVTPNLSAVDFMGESFGGGIGAMAVPWDDRFRRAYLHVPTFGNHPLRLTLPCVGSGEPVREYAAKHPQAKDVLAYFDAAIAARHIHIPTLVAAALFDPAVPPPGQFAVYNALSGQKKLFVRQAGHFSFPGEATEGASLLRTVRRWFATDETAAAPADVD
jgi:cephalosporin-C deacetylase